jgi:hypothetical protein
MFLFSSLNRETCAPPPRLATIASQLTEPHAIRSSSNSGETATHNGGRANDEPAYVRFVCSAVQVFTEKLR